MVERQGNRRADENPKLKVLFCTAAGGYYGMGHLKRCISLIEEGRRVFESKLWICRGSREAGSQLRDTLSGYTSVKDISDAGEIDLIVSDMRETGKKQLKEMIRRAPVISIDDLSWGRKLSLVSIYPLPNKMGIKGNVYGPAYIILNPTLRNLNPADFNHKDGVLLSYGGSDPYNMSGYISSVLKQLGVRPIIVRGPLFQYFPSDINGDVVVAPENIYELINDARVLITSFGLTMYEAFFVGTPVILINSSRYHSKLAQKTPVINLGYRKAIKDDDLKSQLQRILTDKEALRRSASENRNLIDGQGVSRVVSIIENSIKGLRKDCLFRHGKYRACFRRSGYTIMRCKRCGDLFLFDFSGKAPDYCTSDDREYYLREYKTQYGKTYIEDKENIVKLGVRRIKIIESIIKPTVLKLNAPGSNLNANQPKMRLLDIGCALGFFVEVADKRGWEARGIEISSFASDWGRKNLSLEIVNGSFLDVDVEPGSYDAVTFFFTAEHFMEIERVVDKTYNILKPNGVIALALPNRGGITYRLDRAGYLRDHPGDHYFDSSVRNLKRFLKIYGFKKRKITITGIHPERFFLKIGIKKSFKVLDRLYTFFAKTFNLGDTFEYYGIKV
jgi:spore coat polysaccharide biosynthesis predicted glycosyltransferase SpsG/SAM-dependent methyltransferase